MFWRVAVMIVRKAQQLAGACCLWFMAAGDWSLWIPAGEEISGEEWLVNGFWAKHRSRAWKPSSFASERTGGGISVPDGQRLPTRSSSRSTRHSCRSTAKTHQCKSASVRCASSRLKASNALCGHICTGTETCARQSHGPPTSYTGCRCTVISWWLINSGCVHSNLRGRAVCWCQQPEGEECIHD